MTEQLKKKVSAEMQQLSGHKKNQTSNIKIKCSEQTARNCTTFSGTQIKMWKINQNRRNRKLLEINIWGKGLTHWRSVVDQNQCQQNPTMEWSPVSEK